ncbi:MAG TPA: type I DNA topoisomerase [Candidatus Paceibacterota bacterium]|nr:type I DNA topoisomerase [Candidatus Paceibacterota bacterium]
MSDKNYKLLVVESPAKAKTIGKYLGPGYAVVASVGHVRDLPKSNKKAIDMERFTPHYEVSAGKEKVLHEIERLAKGASEVLLATDPDREGEAIAWHIAQAVKFGKKPVKRVAFNEITKDAIIEALAHPREIDENLRRAQEARRVLDRLVGYDLSGVIWKKVRYGLSAGRVQSPALRLICEREREIKAFKPERYFTLSAQAETPKKEPLALTCSVEPKEEAEAKRIVAAGKAGSWQVVSVDESEAKRTPKAPFTTSTLQQAASTRLGFSPSNTMRIAQKLYEAGHITYMRTDSTTLSKQASDQIAAVIAKDFGKDLVEPRAFAAKSKNAQEAHEAVRPTDASRRTAGANPDEIKLYGLIWARAVASQMKDARIMRTKIVANIAAVAGAQPIPDFQANGSRTVFRGWLDADPDARGEDVELPKVAPGAPLRLVDISSLEKFTEPPSRYSEAGLIKELEKRGIGRPSTYASILRTLEEREYVTKESRNLRPTDTGEVVSAFLEENFDRYISDTFTAEMEDKLDLIADGSVQYEKTLSDFYKPFSKEVKEKDKLAKATTLGDADPDITCPKCGSPMVIKLGRSGKFLSCSRYPDCDGALLLDGTEMPKDKVIGIHPQAGKEITLRSGKYGPYVEMEEKEEEKTQETQGSQGTPESQGSPEGEPEKKKKRKTKKPAKPKLRRASVPKEIKPEELTLDQAVHLLSLPRRLGVHPETGKVVTANIGRFGPYVVHDGDFRSLKKPDDVYTIELPRALDIFKEPKKKRGFARKKKAE